MLEEFEEIEKYFAWLKMVHRQNPFFLEPSYNVAPTDPIPVVRYDGEDVVLEDVTWGFNVPMGGGAMKPVINARDDSVANRPTFQTAFRERRCLVPASGYYEWVLAPWGKQPVYFKRADNDPLVFAGLWRVEADRVRALHITTRPNELAEHVHERMPAILETREEQEEWLRNPGEDIEDIEELLRLLKPAAPETLIGYPVRPEVNSVKNNNPQLVEPIGTLERDGKIVIWDGRQFFRQGKAKGEPAPRPPRTPRAKPQPPAAEAETGSLFGEDETEE